MFETNVTISGNYYGVSTYDKENNTYVFHKIGKLVTLEEVENDIENGEIYFCSAGYTKAKLEIFV